MGHVWPPLSSHGLTRQRADPPPNQALGPPRRPQVAPPPRADPPHHLPRVHLDGTRRRHHGLPRDHLELGPARPHRDQQHRPRPQTGDLPGLVRPRQELLLPLSPRWTRRGRVDDDEQDGVAGGEGALGGAAEKLEKAFEKGYGASGSRVSRAVTTPPLTRPCPWRTGGIRTIPPGFTRGLDFGPVAAEDPASGALLEEEVEEVEVKPIYRPMLELANEGRARAVTARLFCCRPVETVERGETDELDTRARRTAARRNSRRSSTRPSKSFSQHEYVPCPRPVLTGAGTN